MISNQNATGIEDNIAQELSFHEELDQLIFEQPNGTRIHFSDDQSVLNLFRQHCPNWKQQGITSVPMARRPYFLLCGKQMTKELEKRMRANVKGDDAEKQLYRLFIEECSKSIPGMIVIPNLSTDRIFYTQAARVEIDMIVIHPDCGVFLFNVKNQGQRGAKGWMRPPHFLKGMQKDIKRYTHFAHMLQRYGTDDSPTAVAIHFVICDFANETSKHRIFENKPNAINRLFVLEKSDLRQNEFGSSWRKILEGIPGSGAYNCANGYPIGTFI